MPYEASVAFVKILKKAFEIQMFQLEESDETLNESLAVYIDEEWNSQDSDVFNIDTFKSFIIERISQNSPPETQPLPKKPDPPIRRPSVKETLTEYKPTEALEAMTLELLKDLQLSGVPPVPPEKTERKWNKNRISAELQDKDIKNINRTSAELQEACLKRMSAELQDNKNAQVQDKNKSWKKALHKVSGMLKFSPESDVDKFKTFILQQISQNSPPETQPLPKRLDPPKRRPSVKETLTEYKPTGPIQPDKLQPVKSGKKWKKALNRVSGMFNFSSEAVSAFFSLEADLPNSNQTSKSSSQLKTSTSSSQSQTSTSFSQSTQQVRENVNIKHIYQASYKKIVGKKPLLEQILITNFIISIVDSNKDVTLSRPRTIRKKISRSINRRKTVDSKKAREFLIKKGVLVFDYRKIPGHVQENNTKEKKRTPGRSRNVNEDNVPLALLR